MSPSAAHIVAPVAAMLGAFLACLPLASIVGQLRNAGMDGTPGAPPWHMQPARARFERDPWWLQPTEHVAVPAYAPTGRARRVHRGAHRLSGLAPGTLYAPALVASMALANRDTKRPGITRTERRGIEIT